MLERLLKRVSQGGTFSTQSLALEFDVSKELIEAMLADLVRLGRIQAIEGCAESACAGCGLASACRSKGKSWLTS